jgi:integrase
MSRPPVSIDELIQRDVEMERKKTGSNYKNYEQLRRYLLRFCPNLKDTGISQINESFCAGFRDWLVNSPSINYEKTTKCFIALLNRISNDRTVSWHIENINGYNFKKNAPLCNKVDELPTILNENEIQSFYSFDPTASRGKRTAKNVELYHDYCIFMLETLMRPVDMLLLKTDNIKACRIGCNKPFVQYIPKKMENRICSHKTVMLPLSSTALELIEKYKNQAPDGYIFPFADDRQILKHKNGMERFTKRINKQINTWLKTVDKALNFGKGEDISLYMFRHTSISVALNVRKLPASTVAKLAGTSIAMIEKHYNNHTVVNIPLGILEAFGEKITHRKAI